MPPPFDSRPGSLRLPPGAVDKFMFLRASVPAAGVINIVKYAPANDRTLFVAGISYTTEAAGAGQLAKMAFGATFHVSEEFGLTLGRHVWFPYPFEFVGDGTTQFWYYLNNTTGGAIICSGSVWAWEEPKRG